MKLVNKSLPQILTIPFNLSFTFLIIYIQQPGYNKDDNIFLHLNDFLDYDNTCPAFASIFFCKPVSVKIICPKKMLLKKKPYTNTPLVNEFCHQAIHQENAHNLYSFRRISCRGLNMQDVRSWQGNPHLATKEYTLLYTAVCSPRCTIEGYQ